MVLLSVMLRWFLLLSDVDDDDVDEKVGSAMAFSKAARTECRVEPEKTGRWSSVKMEKRWEVIGTG